MSDAGFRTSDLGFPPSNPLDLLQRRAQSAFANRWIPRFTGKRARKPPQTTSHYAITDRSGDALCRRNQRRLEIANPVELLEIITRGKCQRIL
jgi:hypothetical protein